MVFENTTILEILVSSDVTCTHTLGTPPSVDWLIATVPLAASEKAQAGEKRRLFLTITFLQRVFRYSMLKYTVILSTY